MWNLNGEWKCEFRDGRELAVQVPGCWDTYVEEKDIADLVRFRKTFLVSEIPQETVRIYFGAVSYYCDIFLNGTKLGSHEGMWDGFWADITKALQLGENELTLDIWKPGYHETDRFPLREVLSGFIPDVLCTFGGIWDEVKVETAQDYFVNRHNAAGDMSGKVTISIGLDWVRKAEALQVTGKILDSQGQCAADIHESFQPCEEIRITGFVSNPTLWSTENPALYRYRLVLDDGKEKREIENTFGFREIRSAGSKILLNDAPVYVRGLLHWGYYDSITPTPERDQIIDEIEKVKAYGFNMIKHCLYIPRESYLDLADQMGIMLWIELPLWLPEKTPELENRIRREFPALMEQIAGHPSVVMLSLGCELDDKVENEVLEEMYDLAKNKLGILVRDNSGSGECYGGLAVDYADFSDYHFYADLQNMENLLEAFTPVWKQGRPWVFGEFCDSDTLRDLAVVRKKKGADRFFWEKQDPVKNPICILKPDFFMGYHDEWIEASGIRAEYPLLQKLSLNHSMVHRKTVLEQSRSFQTIGGYNITSIRDVPIATSGLFDDAMEEKFDKEIFRQLNGDVMLVPAWDLTRKSMKGDRLLCREHYGFFGGEYYGLHLLVSNYGGEKITDAKVSWKLSEASGKAVLLEGTMAGADAANGEISELGYLRFQLPQTEVPKNYILQVTLESPAAQVSNSWPVFLYPCPETTDTAIGLFDPVHVFDTVENLYRNVKETDGRTDLPQYDILFCSMLTPEIMEYMKNGGSVVYVQRLKGEFETKRIAFWREGMIRHYEHPMLEQLNYENWMDDLRYFGSATDTAFTDIEDDRFDYRRPIVRRYDCREWRADDYMMELGCGKGKMIATTLRLDGGMGKQPMFLENNRFGRWLLQQAVEYFLKN